MGHVFCPNIQMAILRFCEGLGRVASNCTMVLFWGEVLTQFLVQHCNSQKGMHMKVNRGHHNLLV